MLGIVHTKEQNFVGFTQSYTKYENSYKVYSNIDFSEQPWL